MDLRIRQQLDCWIVLFWLHLRIGVRSDYWGIGLPGIWILNLHSQHILYHSVSRGHSFHGATQKLVLLVNIY